MLAMEEQLKQVFTIGATVDMISWGWWPPACAEDDEEDDEDGAMEAVVDVSQRWGLHLEFGDQEGVLVRSV